MDGEGESSGLLAADCWGVGHTIKEQTMPSYPSPSLNDDLQQHIPAVMPTHCSQCGRPLSDPHSIAIGMGPICEQKTRTAANPH